MNTKQILLIALSVGVGLVSAVQTDMSSYKRAKRSDPTAKFDWGVAVPRWIKGALTGAIGAVTALEVAS